MVRQPVRDKASDIHIEPQESHLRVRYRIDGVLHDAMSLPLKVHGPVLSRIKILSNLNIAERRRPQDGQFSVDIGGTAVDIRVATIKHGARRDGRAGVLDMSVSVRSLAELGFYAGHGGDVRAGDQFAVGHRSHRRPYRLRQDQYLYAA